MTIPVTLLPFVCVAPPLAYALLSLWFARRYFGRSPRPVTPPVPVSVLKPVKGLDAESFKNFASFCRQDHPCFQIVFAAGSDDDPVVPVIRRLMDEFPEVDIELVIDGRTYGPNYKVCKLMNAYPAVKHNLIVICDSDIRVGDQYLTELSTPFADLEVGLVTSLYRTSEASGAAVIESLGITTDMIPNVMVALGLEGLSFALGASMAVRRDALERIGGFRSLVDYLADDYRLGNMVCHVGYRLELSDYFVENVVRRETLSSVLSRQLRWCRTMRISRPWGYFASGITQPFAAVLLALCAPLFSGAPFRVGLSAVIVLYAVRSLVATIFSRVFVKDCLLPRYLWLLPLRDMVAFGTWALAFAGSRVEWRGHRYRVLAGGRMEEID